MILVIPLEDLPELQVGYGFGLVDKEKVPKPDFLKVRNKQFLLIYFIFQNQDVKLITSANKHRFIVPGGVKQLTKEEFEAFTNQVILSLKMKNYSDLLPLFQV